MAELERLDHAVGDHGRPEAGAETEEEHAAAPVAPDRLHDGVVHDLRRLPEGGLVVETDPAVAEVHGLGDHLAGTDRRGDSDRDPAPPPALDGLERSRDHLLRCQRRPGDEPSPLPLVRGQRLHVRAADVDGEDDRPGHGGFAQAGCGCRCPRRRARSRRSASSLGPRWRGSAAAIVTSTSSSSSLSSSMLSRPFTSGLPVRTSCSRLIWPSSPTGWSANCYTLRR